MSERFFVPGPIDGKEVTLSGDEARHLARARRVEAGERVEVFDGLGRAWTAEVVSVGKNRVALRLEAEGPPEPPPPLRIALAVAFPKGDRVDWLVEKATELGVERLIPLLTTRTVVDPGAAKIDRLRRAVVEASKQSGRNRLMAIDAPRTWPALLLDSASSPNRLFCHPTGPPPWLWPAAAGARGEPAIVAVGPEGGFTEVEASRASEAGWRLLGLGATILRVETAAIAAVCAAHARFGGEREG